MKLSDLTKPLKLDLSNNPRVVEPKILLHKPIPYELYYINPRTLLGQEWWDKTRKEVYRSNNWCCQACGDCEHLPLDAHEMFEYDEIPDYTVDWDRRGEVLTARLTRIVPLCKKCHQFIHWLGLSPRTVTSVLNRGVKILLEAGIKVPKVKAVRCTVDVPANMMDDFDRRATLDHVEWFNWKVDFSELGLTEKQIEKLKKQEVLCITE